MVQEVKRYAWGKGGGSGRVTTVMTDGMAATVAVIAKGDDGSHDIKVFSPSVTSFCTALSL